MHRSHGYWGCYRIIVTSRTVTLPSNPHREIDPVWRYQGWCVWNSRLVLVLRRSLAPLLPQTSIPLQFPLWGLPLPYEDVYLPTTLFCMILAGELEVSQAPRLAVGVS